MKPSLYREKGPPALDLLEQAVHLIRGNYSALVRYYIGSIPFVLAFLFFCAEMSQSAFAEQKLAGSSFLVALSYVWMKFWHSVTAHHLHSQLVGEPPETLTLTRTVRLLVAQTALQPTALVFVPIALVTTIPFGWVSAFYQNLSIFGTAEDGKLRSLIRSAYRQTMLWPRQNHVLLSILAVFTLVVFLNWATMAFFLPAMLKTFLGLESVFTRSGVALLNTTFFVAIGCLTFLTVDPLRKSIYVLRCFYGQSLSSGNDIRAGLRLAASRKPAAVMAVVSVALLLAVSVATSAEAGINEAGSSLAPSPGQTDLIKRERGHVTAEALHSSIQAVTSQPKFAWRLPRERARLSEKGVFARFMDGVGETLSRWAKGVGRWLESWLKRVFSRSFTGGGTGTGGWMSLLELVAYIVIGGLLIVVGLLIFNVLRNRGARPEVVSEPILPAPDLRDENVAADQLPEDGWLRLAGDLLDRGEMRLAIRAFYLASLAHLADRGLISLARFKSNLDYDRELRRRAHALSGLSQLFAANLSFYERVWYGDHPVEGEDVSRFAANVQQMKGASPG